jgi:hypothetical protein
MKKSPWGNKEKEDWLNEQSIKRSYRDEVITRIEELKDDFDVFQYGSLSYDPIRYPLYMIKTKNFDKKRKTIVFTGGVHGYETSGVHGALSFLQQEALKYVSYFNIVCAPCISPWAYESINRWNPLAIDPNRSFYPHSPAEECKLFLEAISALNIEIFAHFDLHETTDTDNTVFRPALEKRDGIPQKIWDIPDGFYLVGNTSNPQRGFQKAIIDSVKEVTHIAPSDKDGKIIGVPLDQEGVINYDMKKLFLCGGFSNAEFSTTTEVYPDSPLASGEICAQAQVAALRGGLNYLQSLNP